MFLHLLKAFFLTVFPVDKTFRTLNLLNYNIFLAFVYGGYKGIKKGAKKEKEEEEKKNQEGRRRKRR